MLALRRVTATCAAVATLSVPLVATPASAAFVPVVTTIAGDPLVTGPATELSIRAFDVLPYQGDLLVAGSQVIRRIDLDTGVATVFAGIGSGAYATDIGDGGPATNAIFEGASALALGPDGSVYVGETIGNRVRRIAPDGTISTILGKRNETTLTGDGGPAAAARVFYARGVAVAPDGTLYVSDQHHNRIRRVGTDGIVTTFAGNGLKAFAGDGGPATQASLNAPAGLAIDTDGSLLVADSENHRIRRVKDGVITTVAGIGTAGDPGDGIFGNGVGPNGDGGLATQAVLHAPSGVDVDGDGYLIADTLNHKIRRIDAGGVISTVAGGGTREYGKDEVPALQTNLFAPEDAGRLPDGRLFLADTRAERVRVVDAAGVTHAVGGNYFAGFSGDGGPATKAQLSYPHFLTTAPDGDVLFVDSIGSSVIRRVDAATGRIGTVYGFAVANDDPPDDSLAYSTYLRGGRGISMDATGALYLVDGSVIRRVDPATGRQRRFAGKVGVGADAGDGLHRLDATFHLPYSVYAAQDGSVYVGDLLTHRVRRIAPDGTVTAFAGNGVQGDSGDGGPATQASLGAPYSITGDAAGVIYIADMGFGRVRAVAPDGTISTVVGRGIGIGGGNGIPGPATQAFVQPVAVTALPDGTLFVSEQFQNQVLRYDPVTGQLTVLAGAGIAGWREGAGPVARFAFPGGIGWDPVNERVVVADKDNGRIRAVSYPAGGRVTKPAVSRLVLTAGRSVTVAARLVRANGLAHPPGTPATLEYQRGGTTAWTPVATVTSGVGGLVLATHRPTASGRYRWRFEDAGGVVVSPVSGVVVRATISAAWSVSRIRPGEVAYLSGTVRPAVAGERLVVERRVGTQWHPIDQVTVSAGGAYAYSYRAYDSSDPLLRVRRPGDAAHPEAISRARALVVG